MLSSLLSSSSPTLTPYLYSIKYSPFPSENTSLFSMNANNINMYKSIHIHRILTHLYGCDTIDGRLHSIIHFKCNSPQLDDVKTYQLSVCVCVCVFGCMCVCVCVCGG